MREEDKMREDDKMREGDKKKRHHHTFVRNTEKAMLNRVCIKNSPIVMNETEVTCLRYCHNNLPRNNALAFSGLSNLQALRCLNLIDCTPGLTNLRGIEFPSSLRSLSLSISNLEASLLPQQLTSLTIENDSYRSKLKIAEEFPSSLRSLKIVKARLMTDFNHFRPDSMLEIFVLDRVNLLPGTTVAHLPRSVTVVRLSSIYGGPLYVVGCPPSLQTFRAAFCDKIIHDNMEELPSGLRDVEINIRRLSLLPASVRSLSLEYTGTQEIPGPSRLPSGLRFLSLPNPPAAAAMMAPPAFYRVRNGDAYLRGRVRILSDLYGPPDWYQLILSELVHYRPPSHSHTCGLCFDIRDYYTEMVEERFGVASASRFLEATGLLSKASFMIFLLDHRRYSVIQIPQEMISSIAAFLFFC